jgi:hypothetical protein
MASTYRGGARLALTHNDRRTGHTLPRCCIDNDPTTESRSLLCHFQVEFGGNASAFPDRGVGEMTKSQGIAQYEKCCFLFQWPYRLSRHAIDAIY